MMMAKKKKASEELEGDVGTKTIDSGIEFLLNHAKKNSGGHVCLGSELADRIWGIPCDYLSYRWLVDQNCYSMSRIIGVAGMKESCKSAFAMSMAKVWIESLNALCIYVDTENKKSASLYRAVVGEDKLDNTMEVPAFATEDWQTHVLSAMSAATDAPQLKNRPLIFIVDSLGGVDTIESSNRIDKEGMVNPRNTGGMVKCKSHNEFFRHVNKYLYNRPFCLLYINHLSDDPNSPIPGAKRKPGGTGQDYHAVLDLWFSAVKATPVHKKTRGFSEKMLKIVTNKNSMGVSKRNIEIPYRWENDEQTGRIEKCWFDWDAATAMMLADDSPNGPRSRLDGIIKVTENANKYSCKELGLVGVTDTEMGEAIRADVNLRERISDALGINRIRIYPEMDMDAKTREIYEKSLYSKVEPKEQSAGEYEE
jgi:hypothetical protein